MKQSKPMAALKIAFAAFVFLFIVAALTGCAFQRPLRGGTSGTQSGAFRATLAQSENPQGLSSQTVERSVEIEPGLTIPPDQAVTFVLLGTNQTSVAAVPSRVREVTKTTTTIGAAQKDTARELAAKLKATAPAFYVGIACIISAGALFYFGWHTPAIIAAALGAGLMLFAQLVAAHTVLMLIVALGAIAILIVFHAYNKGALDHIKSIIPLMMVCAAILAGCAAPRPNGIRSRMVEIHAKYRPAGINFDQWAPRDKAEFNGLLGQLVKAQAH